MSLTSPFGGTAPFQPDGRHCAPALPDKGRYWEPWPRRMRAVTGGRTVLDSRQGVIFWETGAAAQILYPRDDLAAELLDSDDVSAGPTSDTGEELVGGYVAVDFGGPDLWFEEDQPIYAHPRDPYHRVDTLLSSRHVVARVGDVVVADSSRPKLLFETGLPIRYYVPLADVDVGLLRRSDTVSECPYKGDGQHWHLHVGGEVVEDAAWSLPHPRPEALIAENHLCFYPGKVSLSVDGEVVER